MTSVSNSASRVRQHRLAMRSAGMRPIQIWVPDTRRADFADEARRQSDIIAKTDQAETTLDSFLDAALADTIQPNESDQR